MTGRRVLAAKIGLSLVDGLAPPPLGRRKRGSAARASAGKSLAAPGSREAPPRDRPGLARPRRRLRMPSETARSRDRRVCLSTVGRLWEESGAASSFGGGTATMIPPPICHVTSPSPTVPSPSHRLCRRPAPSRTADLRARLLPGGRQQAAPAGRDIPSARLIRNCVLARP